MKNILLFIIILLNINVYSQEWLSKLPKNKNVKELTLHDYQNAFNEYWKPYNVKGGYYIDKEGKEQKAAGWKLFKRKEYELEKRVNSTTGVFPKESATDIYKKWLVTNNKNTRTLSGSWQSIGPDNSEGGYFGTGRLNCIAFHPSDNDTYWVGSPSGGLWITSDDGYSWSVLTDTNEVLGVSDIAVSSNYETNSTLYIATGDKDGGSMFSLGSGVYHDNNSIGVLKSIDGGLTWNTTGLSFSTSQDYVISRLLMDPSNEDILYAATNDGIYKTTDAGTSWNNIHNPGEYIIDMEFKSGTSSTIYASTKDYWGDVYIYRSTDSGSSWATEKTYASDDYRVDLAVSPNNDTYVYAIVAKRNGELSEISLSTNSGNSFNQQYAGGNDKNLLGYFSDKSGSQQGQGGYDLAIAVSPSNVNHVIVGGVNAQRSTDSGASWDCSSCWTSSTYYNTNPGGHPVVHADKHMQKYRSNGDLFECNDGGVYKSSDDGLTWENKTGNLVISQLYRLSVAQTRPDATLIGLQDNGCKRMQDGNWSDVKGGDGMEVIIDYNTYDIQYGAYTNGNIGRTDNNWGSETSITKDSNGNWINGIDAGESGYWVTPYVIDQNSHNTLYLGLKDLWKSTDKGDAWSKISTINTSDNIRSIAISSSNSSVIYMADPSKLWVTTDGGSNWTERTAGLPVASNSITYLQVKDDDPATIWVTFGGFDGDRVYKSTDYGVNWSNISSGLPDIPVMCVIQNKQNIDKEELYIGTDVGVYIKSGTADWETFNKNLPNVVVNELEIYYDVNPNYSRIRAATSGRGTWESDLYERASTPMSFMSCTTTQTNTTATHQGNINQEVIKLEIETTGDANPIDVTSITFNTTGTSDANADVATAKVFFTGKSDKLITNRQFGNTQVSPNGSLTVNSVVALESGTNYFWIVFDVKSGATIGNVIDAQCTSVTVNNVLETPDETNPAGSRTISNCTICTNVTSDNADDDTGVTHVSFNTIDNGSSGAPAYTDNTAISTDLARGDSHTLTVRVNTAGDYRVDAIAWIDWNHDCDFDDDGEAYYLGWAKNKSDGVLSITPEIIIPESAMLGNITMRVRATFYSNANPQPTSCGDQNYSEGEDYTLNIVQCLGTTTTWNEGTGWSDNAPDSTRPAIINGIYTTDSGDIDCCTLTINNSCSVTIKSGKYINVNSDFINNGTLIIQHEGSFVQNSELARTEGSGAVEVHKTTPTYLDYDYTYWSSPVNNETIESVFAGNPPSYIFSYNTATFLDLYSGSHPQTTGSSDSFDDDNNDWELASGATILRRGKGYVTMGEGSPFPLELPPVGTQTQSVVFDGGMLNNGLIKLPVCFDKYNQDIINTDPDPYSGADSFHLNTNLIGNPYPSAIDVVALRTDEDNLSVLEGTFYIWTHDTAISSGGGPWAWNFTSDDYATITVDSHGNFSEVAAGNGNGTHASRYIASGQGFMANVIDNAEVSFKNSMRVTGNNDHFFHVSSESDKFWLNLTNEKIGLFRQLFIGFSEDASDFYVSGQDARRLENGNNIDFYSIIKNDNSHFAIQNLGEFKLSKSVKLGVEMVEEGVFTISIDRVDGIFNTQNIYLLDKVLNVTSNLSIQDYRFTISNFELFDIKDRFEILFIDETVAVESDSLLTKLSIYPNPSKGVFNIQISTSDLLDITVYDVTGKLIQETRASNKHLINLRGFNKGFYFAKISCKGQSVVKKIILN